MSREIILKQLEQAARRADLKHGPMYHNKGLQIAVLAEELGEVSKEYQEIMACERSSATACLRKHQERYYEELLDLGGALIRILEELST